jgi:hypothetical protein
LTKYECRGGHCHWNLASASRVDFGGGEFGENVATTSLLAEFIATFHERANPGVFVRIFSRPGRVELDCLRVQTQVQDGGLITALPKCGFDGICDESDRSADGRDDAENHFYGFSLDCDFSHDRLLKHKLSQYKAKPVPQQEAKNVHSCAPARACAFASAAQ